jgi:hypothetical protein
MEVFIANVIDIARGEYGPLATFFLYFDFFTLGPLAGYMAYFIWTDVRLRKLKGGVE